MDIPQVLAALGLIHLQWGQNSNTGNSYAEFASTWPAENPTIPSEAEMEAKWAELVAGAPAAAALQAQIDALAAIIGDYGRQVPMMVQDDVTTTSNLPADVSGISFAIGPGETWLIEAKLFCRGSTAGMRFALSGPPNPVSVKFGVAGHAASVAAETFDALLGYMTPTALSFLNNATPFTGRVVIDALVKNGPDAGQVKLLFASATNTQSNKILAGSFGTARRIT